METLLSVQQAAKVLGLSPRTIYNFAAHQRIPVQRVGRRLMFRPSALQDWLSAQVRPATHPHVPPEGRHP